MELSKLPLTNDVLNVTGLLTLGGTLSVTNISVNALAAGDSFKLFNAGAYAGNFTVLNPPRPAVNLRWNTNALATNGVLAVVPVPVPVIRSISLAGGNLLCGGTNGWPGDMYYVLCTTNISLPVGQWTRLATNIFDAGGNFNFTNVVDGSLPQRFYRLEMP
jgi:hypothetical protein